MQQVVSDSGVAPIRRLDGRDSRGFAWSLCAAARQSRLLSILIGIAVFVIWVAPDRIAPAWHHFILFDNPDRGPSRRQHAARIEERSRISSSSASPSASIAVPILEELFWRGWLMRWLIDSRRLRTSSARSVMRPPPSG